MTSIVIQTTTKRKKALAETLTSLAAANLTPDFISEQTEPASLRMNGINAHRALRGARKNTNAALLLEDDLRFNPHLPEWLAFLERTSSTPTLLYLASASFAPDEVASAARGARTRIPNAVVLPVRRQRLWWGSQAVWIPREIARAYLDLKRVKTNAGDLRTFDTEFRTFLALEGVPLRVLVPNVVQHLEYRNLVSPARPVHKSFLYREDARPPRASDLEVVPAGPAPEIETGSVNDLP